MEHCITALSAKGTAVYYCGHMLCLPGHRWGPSMRDHYLLHYIHSGKGEYRCGGRSFHLGAGNSFLLFPGSAVSYQADMADPWAYSWAAFSGEGISHYLGLAGLSPGHPIHQHTDPAWVEKSMVELLSLGTVSSPASQLYAVGILYRLLASMLENSSVGLVQPHVPPHRVSNWYLDKSIAFIQTNYAVANLTVGSIANYVGLERSYFAKLFSEELNLTPHQFLLRYRMEKASRLLVHTDQPVTGIAASVGFLDPAYFTKVFRKHIGCPPSEFRRNNLRDNLE